ncbi:tripartite tricarboxylate transporter substrate binding protein [Sediminicoccus sp. KRV36]|uniref:Bug family tripartite tricarboxylate transporter substrate binding protein n=1 Tax=Sediminicoccus sp. KRV36 TaxID=3133721 RepID=UPI00200FCD0C|nr:tripartite tricarboxylate transporter substrate binding protein [Sediminicoccus rosea]UPY38208.1 tripartite tricarboxylate transporter substrate binding protein [Sediminicoccus rosea]
MKIARRAALAAPFLPFAAAAQSWPDRPIRIVVAFPAGSVTDSLVRNLVEPLSRELGQSVIIDNRPGGNGVVGTMAVKGAAPDGYSMAVLSVTNGALNTYLVRNLAYDPIRDFTQLGFLAEAPYLMVVPNSSPARNLAEFIALARSRPGELTFSHGNASALIGSELLSRMAGLRMLAIPSRGGPEALTEVLAGRIDSTLTDFAAGLAQVREGRVRALGVTTPGAFPLAPEIPPISATVPGYELTVWFGLASPAGTPAPVVARFSEALTKVLGLPEVRERLGRLGFAPRAMPPEQWRDYLQSQITTFTRLAREVGLEPS